MKLGRLVNIIDQGYGDGLIRQAYDQWRKGDPIEVGDTLAHFVMVEIAENFDETGKTWRQVDAALGMMRSASRNIDNVIDALNTIHCPDD